MQKLNLDGLLGKVKRICNVTKTSSRIVDAIIVAYTYDKDMSISKRHKIDYITTTGVIGHMYINKNTVYSDIEVSNHVKHHLEVMSESLIKRKKAQDEVNKENARLKELTMRLLEEEKVMTNDDFKSKLTSVLREKSIIHNYTNSHYGKENLSYIIDSDTSLYIRIKNHFINQIRLETCKPTELTVEEVRCLAKGYTNILSSRFNDTEIKGFSGLVEEYRVFKSDDKFLKYLKSKNISLDSNEYFYREGNASKVSYNAVNTFDIDSQNPRLLTDDSIEIILNILKAVKTN